jgi:hypothetical protein
VAKGSASCCTHSLTHVHKRVSAELVTHSPSEAPEQLSCCRNRQWATVNPRAVLEVGDGALTHHLSRRFYGFARVVATDSGCDLAARCCGAPASAANTTTTTTSSAAASCSASCSASSSPSPLQTRRKRGCASPRQRVLIACAARTRGAHARALSASAVVTFRWP